MKTGEAVLVRGWLDGDGHVRFGDCGRVILAGQRVLPASVVEEMEKAMEKARCPHCYGSGAVRHFSEGTTCDQCDGTGVPNAIRAALARYREAMKGANG